MIHYNYILKMASVREVSPLRYVGAFTDGMQNQSGYYAGANCCPKLLQAYKDGRRYKKRIDAKTSN